MKIKYIIFCLLISLVYGCLEKDNLGDDTGAEAVTYVIRKGNHSVDGDHFKILRTNRINCEVVFDSTAAYQSGLPENQLDVNKLIGFSDCTNNHHQNSARIGWAWNGQAVRLYAYAYVNGERVIKPLGDFPLNRPVTCSVAATGDQYYFSAGTIVDSISRFCASYSGTRYKLYPYFGGNEVAPHDITIRMKVSE